MTLEFPFEVIRPTVEELGWVLWVVRRTRCDEFYTPWVHPSLEFIPADEEDHDPSYGPFDKYDCRFDNRPGKRLTHNQRLAYARAIWGEFTTCERLIIYFELHNRFAYRARTALYGTEFRAFAQDTYVNTRDDAQSAGLHRWLDQMISARFAQMRAAFELLLQLLDAHGREIPDETYRRYQGHLADYRAWADENTARTAEAQQEIELAAARLETQFRHLDLDK